MSTSNGRARSSGAANRPNSRSGKPVAVNKPGLSNNAEKRQIVGQYMLGKTIGEGTFGKVKLAIHVPTGEKVAVKILEKSRIKEQADVRRVNREIKILKKARHGNIIQLYEVLDTQNTIYLIMECAEGGEMFDYIVAQKHVAEVQACKFLHQIIDGVELLHQNEITHRDLKPENLLLKASPDGWLVKIVDFGLSNTHEGNKLLSTACGSPCYAAPEMIAGKKYNGPLADLWSIGVILFALVCGFLPFEDPNTSVLYKKILAGDYKAPKWISNEVRDLIACILEVDPKKRFSVSDIRKHPWYTMVAESAIPREVVNVYENEQTRAETLAALTEAGLDTQAVMDGVISHACNPLTAMYYLLEQKHRTMRARQAELLQQQQHAQVKPSSSGISQRTNVSHPETTVSPRELVVPVAGAHVAKQHPPSHISASLAVPQQTPVHSHQSNLAANFAAAQQSSSPKGNKVAALFTNGIAPANLTPDPYKQPPPIMQQHFKNQQAAHTHAPMTHLAPITGAHVVVGAMPSLDVYMKTTMGAPGSAVIGEPHGGPVLIPKLKLPAAKGVSSHEGGTQGPHRVNFRNVPAIGTSVMTSQTSRNPQPNAPNATHLAPNSAREAHHHLLLSGNSSAATSQQRVITVMNNLPVESDVPVQISDELLSMMPGGAAGMSALGGEETGERPNTRRSHARSRGEGSEGSRAAAAAAIAFPQEAMGSLNLDDMVPLPLKDSSANGVSLSNKHIGVYGAVPTITDQQPITTTQKPVVLNAQVPDMPPRSSSAGIGGGRRGKNLTGSAVANGSGLTAAPPTGQTPTSSRSRIGSASNKPPSAGASASSNTNTNPRTQAIRNKLAAQGTTII